MRLIRRPWKGCQFWDVPFTIPWKGCKIQKWGLRKWGYRIWFFWSFKHVAHAVVWSSGGWGVGGCINVLDEHFLYITEDAHVAHAAVWSSGGGGARPPQESRAEVMGTDLLRWVPSSSVLTADGARGFAASCVKDYPTKGSRWSKSTTNKISFLRLIIFEVVCGVNPIEPLLLVLSKWMEHGNTWKNGDLRRCSTKNTKRVQKKYTSAYSWTWCHNAALLQTVASALPQALWHR